MKSCLSQIKPSAKSLSRKPNHVEDWVSGLEVKEDIIEKSNECIENRIKKYEWNMQELCDPIKRSCLQIINIEEVEEAKTKGIGNIFNKIIGKFPISSSYWERCLSRNRMLGLQTDMTKIETLHGIL
jgi:hypothetical protein